MAPLSRVNQRGLKFDDDSLHQEMFETEQREQNVLSVDLKESSFLNPLLLKKNRRTCDEVIHVAIVCAGYNSSRLVVTLIKSILFYRRNVIHFHFISDSNARLVLSSLFKTWSVPSLEVSFYPSETISSKVSWIPNKHYSGIFGLLKLTLPDVLPKSLKKVIVLDTDVTLATDIGDLWDAFDDLVTPSGNYKTSEARNSKRPMIGLVENQSDWYLGKIWKKYKPWPALDRGFNTGVMMLDLVALRSEDFWNKTWISSAEKYLPEYQSTQLADQDIFNVVILENPWIVFKVSRVVNMLYIPLVSNCYCHYCHERKISFPSRINGTDNCSVS